MVCSGANQPLSCPLSEPPADTAEGCVSVNGKRPGLTAASVSIHECASWLCCHHMGKTGRYEPTAQNANIMPSWERQNIVQLNSHLVNYSMLVNFGRLGTRPCLSLNSTPHQHRRNYSPE